MVLINYIENLIEKKGKKSRYFDYLVTHLFISFEKYPETKSADLHCLQEVTDFLSEIILSKFAIF